MFNRIKLGILCTVGAFLALCFLFSGKSYAADDLLGQIFEPTKSNENDTMINLGDGVQRVGNKVIKGSVEVGVGGSNRGVGSSPSIIVKVTRLLLILTIALSVTMILYNGMIYIIETGRGKEGKSLVQNVLFIVVGILVSLFSVVIINVIQSIPTTLDEELATESNNGTDNTVLKGQKMKWSEFRYSVTHKDENKNNKVETYTVTVKYVFSGGGEAAPSVAGEYAVGNVFRFVSPEIQYYKADKNMIRGIGKNGPQTFTVTYSPIEEYDNAIATDDDNFKQAQEEIKKYFINKGIKPYTGEGGNRFVEIGGRELNMIEAYLLE